MILQHHHTELSVVIRVVKWTCSGGQCVTRCDTLQTSWRYLREKWGMWDRILEREGYISIIYCPLLGEMYFHSLEEQLNNINLKNTATRSSHKYTQHSTCCSVHSGHEALTADQRSVSAAGRKRAEAWIHVELGVMCDSHVFKKALRSFWGFHKGTTSRHHR